MRVDSGSGERNGFTRFWFTRVSLRPATVLLLLALGEGPAPAGEADPSHLRLLEDFEGRDFSPSSGLFYKDNKEQRAGTYRIQGQQVRSGKGALEVSVVPHCPRDGSKCSERAEIWERKEVLAAYDATLWYAFSMRLDDPPPTADHRYVVAQWKREIRHGAKVDYSPFLAIRIIRGHLAITIDSDAMPSSVPAANTPPSPCPDGMTLTEQRPDVQQTRLLVAGSEGATADFSNIFNTCVSAVRVISRAGMLPPAAARWIDFVFKVKPGPQGDGEIEVVANGAWIASVRGRIGHQGPDLGANQYFKFGPYRDGGRDDAWRVFYDDFRRGPSCEDVADTMLCRKLSGG